MYKREVPMTSLQILITLLVIALVTILTRALPFLFFPAGKKTPEIVNYLGTVLPFAAMAMLVVYCFKSVSILRVPMESLNFSRRPSFSAYISGSIICC